MSYEKQQPDHGQQQFQAHQPGAKTMMSPGGGNRNALNKPFNTSGDREWSYGLCDCCSDFGTWCLSCWCPCMQYSKNKTRLEFLDRNGRPEPNGGEACGSGCWTYGCLAAWCGLGWIMQIGTRHDVRQRYRVEGGTCGDVFFSACCHSCALTQESREIKLEETHYESAV
ncbi:hypothetical protein FRB94_003053 [Tulasnella sp. JGI-2019a]|nr:hypothetical protein FRB94_003053 [Tulasnella sp. JGI-2019a]KAG9005304.1 hypothetical protein FRB93_009858 [Tulasnella sp. JGI-2019a]